VSKNFFIQTYGCQANIRDSEIISQKLFDLGFKQVKDYKRADVIILNSCSVRQKSEDKIYGWGAKFSGSRSVSYPKKEKQIVIVTGCLVGSAKGGRKRYPISYVKDKILWADYLLAPKEEEKIPEILVKEGLIERKALGNISKGIPRKQYRDNKDKLDLSGVTPLSDSSWSYVNISTGCDNFCSYCVVPYARGEEISRPMQDILDEVKHLAINGKPNVMLVAQNVNSWGLDRKSKFKLRTGSKHKIPFAKLLRKVNEIKGIYKVSFMSANPFDFTEDLIDTLTLPKVDKYLHMAVQSGDNEILKKMNRRHTVEEFYKLVEKIKKTVPEMRLGTDIIVGFCGETEAQFENTVKLFKNIKFEVAFISIYSPRKGTTAERFMKDDVPLKEKKRRHARLTKIWKDSLK